MVVSQSRKNRPMALSAFPRCTRSYPRLIATSPANTIKPASIPPATERMTLAQRPGGSRSCNLRVSRLASGEQWDRFAYSTRLTMLAAADTDAATMVAPATDAGNQFCLNQYQRGAFSFSQ